MDETIDLVPRAVWIEDCQGKEDYDGPILTLSARYWPGPGKGGSLFIRREGSSITMETIPYGPYPSAHASILFRFGAPGLHDGGGDYLVWKEETFAGETEEVVKKAVQSWASDQMIAIMDALGGRKAFKKP